MADGVQVGVEALDTIASLVASSALTSVDANAALFGWWLVAKPVY